VRRGDGIERGRPRVTSANRKRRDEGVEATLVVGAGAGQGQARVGMRVPGEVPGEAR
jgi:hypothetical protein